VVIVAYPVAGKQKSIDLCVAFQHGAPPKARGAVFYGVNSTNIDAWNRVKRRGENWYCIDNSYFDKTRGGLKKPGYFRVTRNAFQVKALDHATDGKRFAALEIEVKPMRDYAKPGHVVAVEQSKTFMQDIARDERWLTDRIELAHRLGFPVRVRPWSGKKPEIMRTLPADLEGAKYLLTHSSAAAVEALIVGVDVEVSSMSAVHHVEPHDRLHAFGVLADNQFNLDEIRNGKAWAWLNRDR
jgi:hypothetical protein